MLRICLFLSILSLLNLNIEATHTPSRHHCSNSSFTPNGTFHANLLHVFSSLVSKATSKFAFYKTSSGHNSSATDTNAYGSFLCIGRVSVINLQECQECVADAIKSSSPNCPKGKEFISSYDKRMLRYSNRSFFSIMALEPYLNETNQENIEQSDKFMHDLLKIMNRLASEVFTMESFAAVNEATVAGKPVHNLAQCVPDISGKDCYSCLSNAILHLRKCCWGKRGGDFCCPVAFLGSLRSTAAIVASTTTGVVALLFALAKRMKMVKKDLNPISETTVGSGLPTTDTFQFSLITTEAATNNFSEDNKLGEGGFGAVYRLWCPNVRNYQWQEKPCLYTRLWWGTSGHCLETLESRNALENNGSSIEKIIHAMMRCIHIGLLCVQADMEDRPTMASVIAMLTSDTVSLPLSQQPACAYSSCSHQLTY